MVVRLNVKEGYVFTSPTWGPSPPYKQALTVMERTHPLYSCIILCTYSIENNAFSVLHYVIKVTYHYRMLHRFEIHSALKLRARLYHTAAWQPRVFERLLAANIFLDTESVSFFFFCTIYADSPPFHLCRGAFQCLTALY